MDITWHGHSSVRLVSADVALLADPYPNGSGTPDAQIVLISNDSPQHSASVAGEPRIIDGPGQYEVQGYNITGIGTALNDEEGSLRINTVYVIRAEGLAVCYLGHLNIRLTASQLDSLGSIDVLITPSGGESTLGPKEIAALINVMSPRIVIPVHYAVEGSDDGLGPVAALLSEMNTEIPDPQPRLSVTQTNLPRETRVVLFTPRQR